MQSWPQIQQVGRQSHLIELSGLGLKVRLDDSQRMMSNDIISVAVSSQILQSLALFRSAENGVLWVLTGFWADWGTQQVRHNYRQSNHDLSFGYPLGIKHGNSSLNPAFAADPLTICLWKMIHFPYIFQCHLFVYTWILGPHNWLDSAGRRQAKRYHWSELRRNQFRRVPLWR